MESVECVFPKKTRHFRTSADSKSLNGVQEVGGSNPLGPIKKRGRSSEMMNVPYFFPEHPSMRTIVLSGLESADGGMIDLKELRNLTDLCLRSTKVTDAGLKVLVDLKNLKRLELEYTKVTDAGVKELQNALPNCKIER
jgi:Leucine Rich repeat